MQAALAPRGDARTYLIHFVGGGLEDERYVVETFRSLASGDIVPVQTDGSMPARIHAGLRTTVSKGRLASEAGW